MTDRIGVDGALQVKGLAAFRRDLRRIDPRMSKALQVAHKRIAEGRAAEAKGVMSSARGPGGRASKGVRPRARQRSASIALLGSNKFVRAMEFGTRFHFLFGNQIRADAMRRRVFPPWVGNQFAGGDWVDGLHGGFGHFVHPAIQRWIDSGGALDELTLAYEQAFREAYPEPL